MADYGIPNLDAMSSDELLTYAQRHKESPAAAVRLAARYADLKSLAIRERLSGKITFALDHESQADAVYRLIPKKHRW